MKAYHITVYIEVDEEKVEALQDEYEEEIDDLWIGDWAEANLAELSAGYLGNGTAMLKSVVEVPVLGG